MGGSNILHAGIISQIQVLGAKRIEAKTVRSYLSFRAGERYGRAKADESVKKLFATGLFRDVRIGFKAQSVIVSVAENPLVNRVAFEGNKEIKTDDLRQAAQLMAPEPFSRARAAAAAQAVLERYRREGYYGAQVEPKLIEAGAGRVNVVFEIREGTMAKVAAIDFTGNHAFSAAELRGVIVTSQSSLLDFFKSTSRYDPDRLNLDRELLRRHYLNSGYADVRVNSASADMDPQGKGFFLTFAVDEGPRYRFGAVDLQASLPSLEAGAIKGYILTRAGEPYNAELVEKSVEALSHALAEKGFPFGEVRPRIQRDAAGRTISVTYAVGEGPSVYIERIDITGNRRTYDNVIRREIRIAEGDAYNRVMAEKARQRLLKLGFFKTVRIGAVKGSAAGRVVLDVAVEEQATGELGFAGGYSSAQGVTGELSYKEQNLLGTGQSLQVKLDGGLVSGGVLVSWTEPRFLDNNFSLGADAFVHNDDYRQVWGYAVTGYEDLRMGGSLRLGVPLSDTVTLNTNYTLMRDQVYNVDSNASLAVKQIEGTAIISSGGSSVVYDTRDNARHPTRGVYIQGGQEIAGLGGDVNFLRSAGEIRGYYPLSQDITLAGRATGGAMTGWGGQEVRIADAFFKGGQTIRGFQSAGLGPRDAATGYALGGTTFYSATTEVRFPLPFLPRELGLSAAVFTDAGSLFGTNAQNFANAYVKKHGGTNTLAVQDSAIVRASAGASLIWDSPVGPLRVDYANAFSKAPFDKTKPFSFSAPGW